MSDPRYPAAFQRPNDDTTAKAASGDAAPAVRPGTTMGAVPAAQPSTAVPAAGPTTRPRASARSAQPARPAPAARADGAQGNRIVLLGAEPRADDAFDAPRPRRNRALGCLYALAGALLALALLGGWWSQGFLRGSDLWSWGPRINPDGLLELWIDEAAGGSPALPRLLVQLAPTLTALGALALLIAIVLPVLTRRPR